MLDNFALPFNNAAASCACRACCGHACAASHTGAASAAERCGHGATVVGNLAGFFSHDRPNKHN